MNGDTVRFDSTSAVNLSTENDIPNLAAITIVVTSPPGAVTIAGDALNLSGGIDLSAATQNLTVTANLALGAAQTWSVSQATILTVTGTVTNGGFTLTVNTSGTCRLDGNVSGAGG